MKLSIMKYVHTSTFLATIFVPPQLLPLFVLDKSTAWNRCQQHPYFKNVCKIAQASKIPDPNVQHFPFGFTNTFTISLHALCTPRSPTNSLILSWIGVFYLTVGCTPLSLLTRAWQWFPVLNVSKCLSCDLISNGYGRPLLLKLRGMIGVGGGGAAAVAVA
jgi:hypothetical protein